MKEYRSIAYTYFSPPENYFWKWADDGRVIDWTDGCTICYREDFVRILRAISGDGFPRMGSLLLLLAACRGNWKANQGARGILMGIFRNIEENDKGNPINDTVKKYLEDTLRFLDLVSELPEELRSGDKRILLVQTIFGKSTKKRDKDVSKGVLNEFESGALDDAVFRNIIPNISITDYKEGAHVHYYKSGITRQYFRYDLADLHEAFGDYPYLEKLKMVLSTGVTEVPDPLELELPVEEEEGDLLDQLAADERTYGLTNLTRKLIAALNIPIHFKGSSDQLFGGVSDITNRGSFDRLLLSELANDDDTLTARLANNEALYFRREELPDNKNKKRFVLIDTTLKMWGAPRLFAVSAGLACSEGNKSKNPTFVFALGEKKFTELDMTTKEGVIQSLTMIDPGLSSAASLTGFMESLSYKDEHECIYIADEDIISTKEFVATLSNLKKPLNYVISVNRNGQLQMFHYLEKRRKQICEAEFDLDEILTAQPGLRKIKRKYFNAPAFLNCDTSPLLFPASKVKIKNKNPIQINHLGVIGVTQDCRLLFWKDPFKGAIELEYAVEAGTYYYGYYELPDVFLLVHSDQNKLILYRIDVTTNAVKRLELPGTYPGIMEVLFRDNIFHVRPRSENFTAFNALDGSLVKGFSYAQPVKHLVRYTSDGAIKKFINNGYSVFSKANRIFIDHNNNLHIDSRILKLNPSGIINFLDTHIHFEVKISCHSQDMVSFAGLNNELVKFYRFTWKDGSTLIIDSRGFLHLKSSVKEIPEITIVMIIGQPLAAWASDGSVCGSQYFYNTVNPNEITATEFYMNYILKYIKALQ